MKNNICAWFLYSIVVLNHTYCNMFAPSYLISINIHTHIHIHIPTITYIINSIFNKSCTWAIFYYSHNILDLWGISRVRRKALVFIIGTVEWPTVFPIFLLEYRNSILCLLNSTHITHIRHIRLIIHFCRCTFDISTIAMSQKTS